jgi:membrane peptidoglycan carboxypeptidase
MQQQLQDSIDLTLLDFTDTTDDGTFKLQSAATCIDNDTGEVVAIVGGRSQDAVSHTLNRAFQSHRQPGSSIKPLIVYTPSFERGKTPDTIVNDHKFDGGPSNSGDSYYGDVTIRFAVQKSLNTVAWQLYDELTPKVGLQYLKDMNFTNIVKDDYVTATALGGFTTGVSTLEMASAYSTLENDGMYRNPTCIKSIVDSDNNIIYTSSQKDTVIYTETASRMMTDVMTDVMKSGTGRSANLDNGMPCAGKTGTTNDKKDGWFCGFTRYYTTCVWVGCDMPETVKKLTGSSYPAEIWKNYMDQIHADLTPIDFLPYAQISDDYQDSQDTPADDQTQNNPTDQTVTTPDAGTTTPDKTTTDTNKTDAAGGNTGGNTGDNTDGTTGGNTGENTGGNTGGNGGQNTGGNTGGNTGENNGGNTGGTTGGNTGDNTGGNTGGATGGTTGGGAAQ